MVAMATKCLKFERKNMFSKISTKFQKKNSLDGQLTYSIILGLFSVKTSSFHDNKILKNCKNLFLINIFTVLGIRLLSQPQIFMEVFDI